MVDRGRQRLLALVSLGLLGAAAVALTPATRTVSLGLVAASLLLAVLGLGHAGPGAAIALLAAVISALSALGLIWQVVMPLGLLALALVARSKPSFGAARPALGRVPILGTLLCAAVTPVALITWRRFSGTDLSDLERLIPKASLPLLLLGGAGFALCNALFEELIWRGVLQTRLGELFRPSVALFVQAASFGIAHAHGFPRGLVGVFLAGTWAVMLGVLRQRSGGLLAPVLAHVVADATIAWILIAGPG